MEILQFKTQISLPGCHTQTAKVKSNAKQPLSYALMYSLLFTV